MAEINKIQFRRGSNLSNAGTPSAGEPIYDTTTKKLYIGDGTTAAAGATPSLVAISDDKLPLTGGTITGSLGVGASPSFKLDTQDNSTTWASRVLNTNAGGQGLLVRTDATNGANALGVYANGAYRLTITEALSTFSTNVTVGTKLKLIYGSTSEIKHDDASGSLTLLADQINLKNRAGNETGLTYNSGSGITFSGDLTVPQYIKHTGDTDTHIEFGTDEIKLRTDNSSRLIARNSDVEIYRPLVATSATFSGTVRSTDVFYGNDNGASNPGFRFYNAASGMYHAGSDNLGFAVTGNNVATFTSSSATFAGGVAINGASIGSHKLVVDNGTTSLNRGNSAGDIIDIRGLNNSQLKVSTTGSQFRGNIGLNPGWVTTHIAFGSAISGFSATNTGARIEVPLHATSGQAHGSFKFYTNSGDTQNYSLLLAESGDISAQKRFYVLGNHSGSFGTELYNASSTGHGLKVRGGSSSSQYALFVSNYDQTATLFQVLGNGDSLTTGNLTIGTQQGNKELMTNRARMRHIDGVADANASFSHGDLYVNHISTGNIYMQRHTTFASTVQVDDNDLTVKMNNHASGIRVNVDRKDTNDYGGFEVRTGGSQRWFIGMRELGNDDLQFFNGNSSSGVYQNVLSLNHSNASATFAGNVTVSPGSIGVGGNPASNSGVIDIFHNNAVHRLWNGSSTFVGGLGTNAWSHGGNNTDMTVYALQTLRLSSGGTVAVEFNNSNQNSTFHADMTIKDPSSSSSLLIDGNTGSGNDGVLYLYGHTASNSRAKIYFNNGVSSGGLDWRMGCLRGSNAFALSLGNDDYNSSTNVFAIDGNRKIGIGTDPNNSYKIKISGNIYSDTTSQFANALIGEVTLNSTNYAMIGSNSSGRGIAFCRDGSASYKDLVIKSNGNVSIGGDGGYQKLTVEGGNIYLTTGYQITWSNGNATISNSGYALSINTWDGSNVSECVKFNGSNVTEFRGRIQWNNGGQLDGGNSNYVKFNTWLQGGGNGGIYFPNSGAQHTPEIRPNGNIRTYGSFIFDGYHGTYGGLIFDDIHSNKPTWMFNTSANGGLYYQGGGGWAFFYNRGHSTFNVNGTSGSGYALYVHGSTYTTGSYSSSDRRLKENIKPLENSLDIVMQMQGVSFTRKEHGLKGEKVVEDNKLGVKEIGFIAQDLTEILPEIVDQNEQTTQYSVNYGQITALLVEAIKELKQEINDLKGN